MAGADLAYPSASFGAGPTRGWRPRRAWSVPVGRCPAGLNLRGSSRCGPGDGSRVIGCGGVACWPCAMPPPRLPIGTRPRCARRGVRTGLGRRSFGSPPVRPSRRASRAPSCLRPAPWSESLPAATSRPARLRPTRRERSCGVATARGREIRRTCERQICNKIMPAFPVRGGSAGGRGRQEKRRVQIPPSGSERTGLCPQPLVRALGCSRRSLPRSSAASGARARPPSRWVSGRGISARLASRASGVGCSV